MSPPVLAFVGESGSGKTTLLCAVVSSLAKRGLRVGAIKHSQGFDDPDLPGKDSRRLREAGAVGLVLASRERTIAFREHPRGEPAFEHRMRLLPACDLVLVESYGAAGLPAIEVIRGGSAPRRAGGHLVAVVSDGAVPDARVPVLSIDDPERVAEFVLAFCRVRLPSE